MESQNEHERRILERRQRVQQRLLAAELEPGHQEEQSAPSSTRMSAAAPDDRTAKDLVALRDRSVVLVLAFKQRAQEAASAADAADHLQDEQLFDAVQREETELCNYQLAATAAWEQLQAIKEPQKLHAGIAAAVQHAGALRRAGAGIAATLQAALDDRGAQYLALLKQQSAQVDEAMAAADAEHSAFAAAAQSAVAQAEAEYVSAQLATCAAHAEEFTALLQGKEQLGEELSARRIAGREAREGALAAAGRRERAAHAALRQRLGEEVAALELRLDAAKSGNLLTRDKLEYNVRVLGERGRENRVAEVRQRRMVNALAAELATLQARHRRAQEAAAAERERALQEAAGVEASLEALRAKAAHFARADAASFAQVVEVKEAELKELLSRLEVATGRLHDELGLELPPNAEVVAISKVEHAAGLAGPQMGDEAGLIAACRPAGGKAVAGLAVGAETMPQEAAKPCGDATSEAYWRGKAATPRGIGAALVQWEAAARRALEVAQQDQGVVA